VHFPSHPPSNPSTIQANPVVSNDTSSQVTHSDQVHSTQELFGNSFDNLDCHSLTKSDGNVAASSSPIQATPVVQVTQSDQVHSMQELFGNSFDDLDSHSLTKSDGNVAASSSPIQATPVVQVTQSDQVHSMQELFGNSFNDLDCSLAEFDVNEDLEIDNCNNEEGSLPPLLYTHGPWNYRENNGEY
jgi:hypothetical protein